MAKEQFNKQHFKDYPVYNMIGEGVGVICCQRFDLITGLMTGPIYPIYIFHAMNMMKRLHTERRWYNRFCRFNVEYSTFIYFQNTSKFKALAKTLIAHYKPEFNFKNRHKYTLIQNED